MNYKKLYFKAFNYPEHQDTFVPSEVSGLKGIDIHHIVDRSCRIENLMALTREEHIIYGEIKSLMVFLLETHRAFLIKNNVKFDNEWFEININKYNL